MEGGGVSAACSERGVHVSCDGHDVTHEVQDSERPLNDRVDGIEMMIMFTIVTARD